YLYQISVMRIINIMAFLLLASTAGAQESLDKLISEKLAAIECEKPTEADPLSLNAGVVSSGDSVAVIIKADIAEGWHIYQLVPEHLPYVATEYVLRLPENISADGKWSTSDPRPSNTDRGVLIHEGGVWFVYKTTR